MAAYPNRFSRSALGPKLVDAYPPQNPETDVGASTFNAVFSQVAGLNLAAIVRAVVIAEWNGSAVVARYQAEAWNPNGVQPHPTIARVSAGNYTLTFASSYADENGLQVQTSLLSARVVALTPVGVLGDETKAFAWVDTSNPLVVCVSMFDASGTAFDAPFWLEVA